VSTASRCAAQGKKKAASPLTFRRLPRSRLGDAPREGPGPPLRPQGCSASPAATAPAGPALTPETTTAPQAGDTGRPSLPRPGAARPVTRCSAHKRTPGTRDELAFDSQKKDRNYKNPLTGSVHASRGLPVGRLVRCRRPYRRRGCNWVTVQVLTRPVVSHGGAGSACRAAIWTSRRSTPASSMVVTYVWRSMCGCALVTWMPASAARCRRRRVAACRSILAPQVFSRTGPRARAPAARSRARPTAGGSGTRTILVPLPHPQDPVAMLLSEVGDVRSGGLEDPQAQQAEHGHQGEVARVRRFAGNGEQSLELQVGEAQSG
jgi:hypothetical protein